MSSADASTAVDRRLFISGAAAVMGAPPLLVAIPASAGEAMTAAERTPHFEAALKARLAGREPVEGGVNIELPEIAENGNFVPITIAVTSPMTAEDHVKAIHVLSSGNPVANVATFHLSALNAAARVQSRMRLARTQDVVVIAEHSTGALHIATALVKVTIGGCAT